MQVIIGIHFKVLPLENNEAFQTIAELLKNSIGFFYSFLKIEILKVLSHCTLLIQFF